MKNTRFKLKLQSLLIVVLTIVFGMNANAQKLTVSGTVKDDIGEPVIGASVVEKGTTNGILTNVNGQFTLSVPSNATLVISYIGYKKQEIPVSGQTTMNVTMKEDAQMLGEVVAIGYGTVKKNDATGSVSAIKPEEMNKGLTTNAQDMMVGKIAGVVVTPGGGTPGSGSTIRIRGGSSIKASNDPLIVIDGLPLDNEGIKGVANFLSTINPNDIESFTVLKDASATAIYGSRASNGVVLITTKKGKIGKPTISYNGSLTVGSVGKTLDVMDAAEYRAYVTNLYGDGTEVNSLGEANTNWQSQIYQTSVSHDHNVSLSGGLKHMPYRATIGYTDENGILKTSYFKRLTGSISLSPSLLDDHLKMNFNLKGMLVTNRYADNGVVGAAASMDPTQSVYNHDSDQPYESVFGGYWQWLNDSETLGNTANALATKNPLATLMQKNDIAKSNDLIGNAEFDYKFHFLPELRAHLMLGMERAYGKQTTTISTQSGSNNIFGSDGYEEKYKTNKQLTYYMQYAKDLGVHKFDIMGGYEWQHFYNDGNNAYDGIVKEYVGVDNKTYYSTPSLSKWASESYLVSFFGRLNYNLADQLLMTFTLRDDGSSRFAPDNRWGLFPSAALGWKLNETFLKNNNKINDWKLRLGYGVTGQQNISTGDYQYLATYYANQNGAYYPFGDTYYATWKPNAYNSNLKWEKTTTYNAGMDLSILNNRMSTSLDVYYRPTTDLIFEATVPQGSNFSNYVIQNIGSLYNKGIEFSISGKPVVTKDLTWDVNYNVTYNYNEVTKITTDATLIEIGGISSGTGNNAQAIAAGFPAYSFYVYQQVYDNNGKPIEGLFVDRNADGLINDNDKYLYHHAAPDFTMGLSSKILYKDWDFGVTFHSSIGNYIYNDVASSKQNIGVSGVYSTSGFLSNIAYSALETNFVGVTNSYLSDYYVQNASFVKIDNITIGYSFNKLWNFIKSGRVSLTMQNIATFTSYKGLNPEVYNGIDRDIYPTPVQGVLGLTLNF